MTLERKNSRVILFLTNLFKGAKIVNNKKIAIVIPSFKAHSTLPRLLSSVRIQSFVDQIKIYICNDCQEDNYTDIINQNKDLDIVELKTEQNGGPGVARNLGLKACKEDFITFMDADDIWYSPYAVEILYYAMINAEPNTQNICTTSIFLQEADVTQNDGVHHMLVPQQNPNHPWVFGRLYNTKFLQQNSIDFTDLRAMEDGSMNYQVRLLTEGTNLKIKTINDFTYVWKTGSEHSITRVGADLNNGIPLYNYGNCQLGAALAVKKAIERVFEKNPFNANIAKFATETFVGTYFTYYEALEKSPMYAEQLDWLSKWCYKNIYEKYASNIPESALEQMYMQYMSVKGRDFKKFPDKTFSQWLDYIKSAQWNFEDIDEIHNKLPEAVKKAEESTGVFKEKLSSIFIKASE